MSQFLEEHRLQVTEIDVFYNQLQADPGAFLSYYVGYMQFANLKEKAESFLDLIMETNEDKKIYLNRWESVKDDKVYSKNSKKGFATTFKREEFRVVA